MSESLKLWSVRCPKCQNLLQELPDYSIYRCGGCGAVLRAKKDKVEVNYGSERVDEERVCVISDESESFVEKDAVFRAENNEGKVSDCSETIDQEVGKPDVEEKMESLIENSIRFSRSGRLDECQMSDRGGMDDLQFERKRRDHFQRGKFSTSGEFLEDDLDFSYQSQASRSTRPEIADHERDELLRKLDELRDQLIRVQTINGKAPKKTAVEYHGEHDGYLHDHPSSLHRIPSQLSTNNNHVPRPPYLEHYHGSMNHVHRFEDPFEPQTLTRPQPQRVPSHYHRYMSMDSSCSCRQCYARQLEVPRQIPPSSFNDQRFYHGYNVRDVKDDPQPHSRKPSEPKVRPFPRVCPQRTSFPKENRCFPVLGGTPFVACHNCFKLLKLPKNMYIHDKDEWKMSCGECLSIVSFAVVDGKLVSTDTSTSRAKIKDLESCHEVGSSQASRNSVSLCSEDYANNTFDVRVSSSSFQEDIRISKTEEMNKCSVSSSATTSATSATNEDEQFQDDSFDNTSKYRVINRGAKGSLSSRFDKEKITTNKSTFRGTSLKTSLAREMETPLDDYEDPEFLRDSKDTYKVNDEQKGKKGIESFLSGIIKRSFRDLSRSTGSEKRNVSVNGHFISDRLVKKAEKLAGPIYPGNYWYDYRAGFWGEIGGSCLGIIPSNIQEFNYPMPEKCAGGNTGVVVNGRELHQKDLELLTSRGLPGGGDKSYIVGISGRVVDAHSGKEIVNLGKLAPTVEKLRCGFGMRAPEASA